MYKIFLIILSIIFSAKIYATKLISPDSIWLKSDIDRLAALHVIRMPVNTWPLPLDPLLDELNNINAKLYPEYIQNIIVSVRHQLIDQKQQVSGSLSFSAATEPVFLTQFGQQIPREQNAIILDLKFRLGDFFGDFRPSIVSDVEEDTLRYDGSYIGTQVGNWLLTAGAQDRWWGSGQHHSLILSNSARPVNALSIQRNNNKAFNVPVLKWLGPWTFNGFIGELDDERFINDAKLIGMSFAFSPHKNIDVGLRRTAQWGGDGRPESFDSFIDLLIGKDNCDEMNLDSSFGCNNRESEPGNQLAGIDVTWKQTFGLPFSTYIQMVGEDEAGNLPAKNTFMGGFTYFGHINQLPLSINLEFIDTQLITTSGRKNNVLYEHSIYQTGYRYLGRSIGSSLDNDSRAAHLDVLLQTRKSGAYRLSYSNIELNRDQSPGSVSNHTITDAAITFNELSLEWQNKITTAMPNDQLLSLRFILRDEDIDTKFGDFEEFSIQAKYSLIF